MGRYHSSITCQVEQGTTVDASLTFSAQAQDALDVLSGKMDPMGAFMRGQAAPVGRHGLAMRLAKLFDVKNYKKAGCQKASASSSGKFFKFSNTYPNRQGLLPSSRSPTFQRPY
jgi:uncharacterized protein with beta-barrel porin domain